jgi:hypothetical protein
MNLTPNADSEMRKLRDEELDAVIGGEVSPGYGPLGTRINISPFSAMPLLDPMWEIVGRTGTLPR